MCFAFFCLSCLFLSYGKYLPGRETSCGVFCATSVLFFYFQKDVCCAIDQIVRNFFSLHGCVRVGVGITQTLCKTWVNRVTKFSLLECITISVHMIKG